MLLAMHAAEVDYSLVCNMDEEEQNGGWSGRAAQAAFIPMLFSTRTKVCLHPLLLSTRTKVAQGVR